MTGPLTAQPHPHCDTDALCGGALVKYQDIEGEILNNRVSVSLKPVTSSMSAMRYGRVGVLVVAVGLVVGAKMVVVQIGTSTAFEVWILVERVNTTLINDAPKISPRASTTYM